VEFDPSGKRVLSAGDDGAVQVWNLNGTPIQQFADEAPVWRAFFSPDGRKLVFGATDDKVIERSAQIWDLSSGSRIGSELRHLDGILGVRFSPDGKHVVTASQDQTAMVWDATTGSPSSRPLIHARTVFDAVFDPSGTLVATACNDGGARVWDAVSGTPVTPPLWHRARVVSIGFSPDGRTLLSASIDGEVHLWKMLPSDYSLVDIQAIAQVLSGERIAPDAGLSQLDPEAFTATLSRSLKQAPLEFSVPPKNAAAWHSQEARECLKSGLLRGARMHLALSKEYGERLH
jgi:WD40 repeat protein